MDQPANSWRGLARALIETHGALIRHGDRASSVHGQTTARWRVLFHVGAGHNSVPTVARASDLSRQAVQRVADMLVRDGLACYEPDPRDGRAKRIVLSPSGIETLAKLEQHFERWSARLVDRISLETLNQAAVLLRQIEVALDEDIDIMTRRFRTEEDDPL